MPLHPPVPLQPPAPSDFPSLVEAFAGTAQAVIDLGSSVRAGDEDLPTHCPGWTVTDQLRHVESAEAMVFGEPIPEVDVSGYGYVRHSFGEAIERYVESRRGRSLPEVVSDLSATIAQRMAILRDPMTTAEDSVVGPFGPSSLEDLIAIRTFDIWFHEQDLREALGRPGGLDTPAAAHALARTFAVFGRVVARDAAIAPGHAVVLESSGPVTGRVGARVEIGEDGKARGIPLFTGDARPHEDVPTTSIHLSTRDLMRRAGGRLSTDEVHWSAEGDQDVALRVLDALAITP